jgi:opacity protein-like surface antigen
MKWNSTMLSAVVAVAACGASSAALALDNPLGIYVGAGVGESTIRSDDSGYGEPGYYNDHQFAWKAVAGIRPLSFIGAEYEYIDFGQPGHHDYGNRGYDYGYYGSDSHPRAQVLYGVGYLPIPVPFLDIFVKAGAARLKTSLNDFESTGCTTTTAGGCEPSFALSGHHSVTETRFAYGAGVQTKLPLGFTVRAEYERISSEYGDPDALMVSAVWKF